MSTSDSCLFCNIIAEKIPAKVVYSNEHVIGFHDINPQAPVHVLFVPRVHVATVNDLEDSHAMLVGQLFLAARDYAKAEGVSSDGFRLIMNCNAHAGQTVFHIHLHLLAGAPLPAGFGMRQ